MSDEARVFIDTNVAVYAWDTDDPRGRVAAALLPRLLEEGRLWVSVQVLREFFVTVTRKVAVPLSQEAALEAMDLLAAGGVQHEDATLVQEAARIGQAHQLSFWDALILAAAIRCEARVVYSEDLNHGQTIEGVRVENPFRPEPA